MSFRAANKKFVEPIAQWTMVLGIAALCQPWVAWLHSWSVTICIVGFAMFLVSIHIPAPSEVDEEDTGGASLAADAMRKPDNG